MYENSRCTFGLCHRGALQPGWLSDRILCTRWTDVRIPRLYWYLNLIYVNSRIWSVVNGQCLKTLAEGHDAICQHVQFSPNSKYILSTAHDSSIRLWDFQTSRCLKTYVGHQNAKYCIGACFSV